MTRAGLILTVIWMLTACQPSEQVTQVPADSPLVGSAIETTTLDEPVVGLAEEQATANPEPQPAPADAAEPAPEDNTATADAEAGPAPEAATEEVDPALLTPQAIACQRQGGIWSRIGEGESRACIKRTRDGGKRCDADRDCQGVCLARSGTCAPVDPLFGCNEVLQDDGRRMNLCLN